MHIPCADVAAEQVGAATEYEAQADAGSWELRAGGRLGRSATGMTDTSGWRRLWSRAASNAVRRAVSSVRVAERMTSSDSG